MSVEKCFLMFSQNLLCHTFEPSQCILSITGCQEEESCISLSLPLLGVGLCCSQAPRLQEGLTTVTE